MYIISLLYQQGKTICSNCIIEYLGEKNFGNNYGKCPGCRQIGGIQSVVTLLKKYNRTWEMIPKKDREESLIMWMEGKKNKPFFGHLRFYLMINQANSVNNTNIHFEAQSIKTNTYEFKNISNIPKVNVRCRKCSCYLSSEKLSYLKNILCQKKDECLIDICDTCINDEINQGVMDLYSCPTCMAPNWIGKVLNELKDSDFLIKPSSTPDNFITQKEFCEVLLYNKKKHIRNGRVKKKIRIKKKPTKIVLKCKHMIHYK